MATKRQNKMTVQKAVANAKAMPVLAAKGKATQTQVAKAYQSIRPAMKNDDMSENKPGSLAGLQNTKAIQSRANRIIKKAGK